MKSTLREKSLNGFGCTAFNAGHVGYDGPRSKEGFMFCQKTNHDCRRRAENNHLGSFQSGAARRIYLIDHPFLLGLSKGLFIGVDGDDMLYSDASQARAKEPPMSPKPMMATVSFVLKPLASVSITHPAFLIILVRQWGLIYEANP